MEKIGDIEVIECEPLTLTEDEIAFLDWLWEWQRKSAKSDYIFGPGVSPHDSDSPRSLQRDT